MGARVAMVELTAGPPHLLLTDHLEGDRPVLVYRVTSIEATRAGLEERGWDRVGSFEIPQVRAARSGGRVVTESPSTRW
jgi:hypothetical protein